MKMKFDLISHIQRQKDFSLKTFGPGKRTKGILDHIKKELQEIEEEPESLEWIDVVILALDGAWRVGFTPEEIVLAIEAKQTKNENRDWPDWKLFSQDEVIEHIK